MTDEQRARLAALAGRGGLPEAREMRLTMQRIDARRRASAAHPMHVLAGDRFARARRWHRLRVAGELLILSTLVAIGVILA